MGGVMRQEDKRAHQHDEDEGEGSYDERMLFGKTRYIQDHKDTSMDPDVPLLVLDL